LHNTSKRVTTVFLKSVTSTFHDHCPISLLLYNLNNRQKVAKKRGKQSCIMIGILWKTIEMELGILIIYVFSVISIVIIQMQFVGDVKDLVSEMCSCMKWRTNRYEKNIAYIKEKILCFMWAYMSINNVWRWQKTSLYIN
jgi:hypothetical protein